MRKHFALIVISVLQTYTAVYAQSTFDRVADLNPALFNTNFSEYDQSTSVFCAQLSDVVYDDTVAIDSLYKTVKLLYPGYNVQYKFIEDRYKSNDHQALLWGTKDFMVIAFRGTEPKKVKDWWIDTKFFISKNKPDQDERYGYLPAGHGGFRETVIRLMDSKDIFTEIREFIKRCNPGADVTKFPVYLTGHSLGAGMSQLFITPLRYKKFNFAGAYHFAPPLAVVETMKDSLKNSCGNIVYDVVNYKDFVPNIGLRKKLCHFGKFYRICTDGLVYRETEVHVKTKKFKDITALLKQEMELHSMISHIKALKHPDNNVAAITLRSVGEQPCMQPSLAEGQ